MLHSRRRFTMYVYEFFFITFGLLKNFVCYYVNLSRYNNMTREGARKKKNKMCIFLSETLAHKTIPDTKEIKIHMQNVIKEKQQKNNIFLRTSTKKQRNRNTSKRIEQNLIEDMLSYKIYDIPFDSALFNRIVLNEYVRNHSEIPYLRCRENNRLFSHSLKMRREKNNACLINGEKCYYGSRCGREA